MDKLYVFFPHITAAILILLYFATILIWLIISGVITVKIFYWKKGGNSVWPNYVWRMSQQTWERIIYSIISFAVITFIVLCLVPWIFSSSFHLASSKDYNEAKEVDVALIFGFGYGIDEKGSMTPEASNQFLYDLAMQQVKVKYLIVQEGVYVAAIKDSSKHRLNGVHLIRMHTHNPHKDVNTFEASLFAIDKMDSLNQKQAFVYAHNMQLKRAVADLRKIAARDSKRNDFQFIIPPIPETPFPKKSDQGRTKGLIFYRFIELYLSRVRDAWCY